MTEIPKNPTTNIPQQPQKIEQVKPAEQAEEIKEPVDVDPQTKEITEITENPADRSSVKVYNIENDLKIYTSNPELVEKALEVAHLAEQRYASAGVSEAELKALNVGKAFIDEFQK